MKIYLSYSERIAGLFLLVTIFLIGLFIVGAAVENLWFTPRVEYHLFVTRGEGLRQGSPVLLSGVEVGEVGDINILADNRIDLQILILEEHAHRITDQTKAVVQRTVGIGEKRVLLQVPIDSQQRGSVLAVGAVIPVDEPKDLLEIVASVDLGRYMDTMDKAVSSMDLLLSKLEEDDRMVRMIEAFDELGPTLKELRTLLEEINKPFAALIKDPSVRKTFQGADKVFNDPATRKALRNIGESFDPKKVASMMEKTERLVGNMGTMMADGGSLSGTLEGADRILNDKRIDRLIGSMDRLTNEQKMDRLLSNMASISDQMAQMGPEMPEMAREMVISMRELTIVLKALQKTWILDDETEEVLEEMGKKKKTSKKKD